MPVQASTAPSEPRSKPETPLTYGGAELARDIRTAIRRGTRGSARRYRISEHESDALCNEIALRVISKPLSAPQRKQSGTPREVLRWIDRIERMPPPAGYVATHKHEAGRMVLRPRAERLAELSSIAHNLMRDSRAWIDSADGWLPRDQGERTATRKFPKAPRAVVELSVAQQAEKFRAHAQNAKREAPLTSSDALRERFEDETGGTDHAEVAAHLAAEKEAGERLPAAAMAEHTAELIAPMVEAAARPWWTPRNRQSAYVALAMAAGEGHAAIAAKLGVSTRTTKRLVEDGRALILGQTDPAVLAAARREAVRTLGLAEHRNPLPESERERAREIVRRYLAEHAEQTVGVAAASARERARLAMLGSQLQGKRDSAGTGELGRFTRQQVAPAETSERKDPAPTAPFSARYGNGYGGACSVLHLYRPPRLAASADSAVVGSDYRRTGKRVAWRAPSAASARLHQVLGATVRLPSLKSARADETQGPDPWNTRSAPGQDPLAAENHRPVVGTLA